MWQKLIITLLLLHLFILSRTQSLSLSMPLFLAFFLSHSLSLFLAVYLSLSLSLSFSLSISLSLSDLYKHTLKHIFLSLEFYNTQTLSLYHSLSIFLISLSWTEYHVTRGGKNNYWVSELVCKSLCFDRSNWKILELYKRVYPPCNILSFSLSLSLFIYLFLFFFLLFSISAYISL